VHAIAVYLICLLRSGFPCEDQLTTATWSASVSHPANSSKPCSCDFGFQQCPPGLYTVITDHHSICCIMHIYPKYSSYFNFGVIFVIFCGI